MADLAIRRITDEERGTWECDGVVCLRGVYSRETIAELLASWDNMVAEPSAYGLGPRSVEQPALGSGTYVVPRASHHVPAFRAFLENSPVAALLGDLVGSKTIGHYWDAVFAKDARTGTPTPWHHDAGATAVTGRQLPNSWTPLTPVTAENGLECIAGQHRGETMYWPRSTSYAQTQPPNRPLCPDFQSRRDDADLRFLSWDMEPGDVLVLHPYTPHFSPGNTTAQRRVALATWWYGDDIRWDPRPECEKGHAEAPFAAMPKGGWPGDHPLFPLRWRAANLEEE
jgi:ectoine hydroxylase-related dioxygenase (phytanoyl-CoA dioxygenase family)